MVERKMAQGGPAGGGGVFLVSENLKHNFSDKDFNVKVTFRDVAGLSEAKQEVQEM
jgi:cell division protease FtsH